MYYREEFPYSVNAAAPYRIEIGKDPRDESQKLSLARSSLVTPALPPTLISLSGRGTGPNLIFCPDVGGNVLYARTLIRALGPGPSSFGFRLAPDMLDHLPTLTIEETARRFATDLIASGIGRPLHVVGFSFASYMAVETALQLSRLGHPPDRLWILDMVARPRVTWRSLVRYARTRISPRRADFLVTPAFIRINVSRHPEGYRPILRRFYTLFSRYRPGRYSGAATLAVADGRPRLGYPPDLGWGAYIAPHLDCVTVPGDHLSMIRDDRNAAVLASRFHDQFCKDRTSGTAP